MNKKRTMIVLAFFLMGALLAACGGSAPEPAAGQGEIEIAVAGTLTAVASVPQATDTPVPPAPTVTPAPTGEASNGDGGVDTPPPPATVAPAATEAPSQPTAPPAPAATDAPPPPTAPPPTVPIPTPVVGVVLPVDGGGDDTPNIRNNNPVNGGRNVTLPLFVPSEVSEPMVFRDRMVFQAEVFDANVGTYDGAGIDNVRFTITGPQGDQVHFRQENTPGYCVFGGGEPICNVWVFALTDYRWPDGAPLTSGRHDVTMDIQTHNGELVTWIWSFEVQLPNDDANNPSDNTAQINGITVGDSGSYVVDFQTFGFTPDLLGRHVHFFFDTVPPDQAGVPGLGPWVLYGGPSPFTGYGPNDRPAGATQMCILVANANHTVQANTGNCFPLP